jgi:hypothetical protein
MKEKLEYVNLVHIDTEGADREILKNFPFENILPEVIIFEQNHIPFGDYKEAVIFLKSKGYSLIGVNTDTFCYLHSIRHLFSDCKKKYI